MSTIIRDAAEMPQEDSSRGPDGLRTRRRFTLGVVVTASAATLLAVLMLVAPLNRLTVGVVVILLMMALMLLRIPIGIAMSAAAILGLYVLVGPRAVSRSLQEVVFTSFASWSL